MNPIKLAKAFAENGIQIQILSDEITESCITFKLIAENGNRTLDAVCKEITKSNGGYRIGTFNPSLVDIYFARA